MQPIHPLLAEIDQLREPGELGRMIARLQAVAITVPFAMSGLPDLHAPTRVVASITAGGLGLPDRDCYISAAQRERLSGRQSCNRRVDKFHAPASASPTSSSTISLSRRSTTMAISYSTRASATSGA